MAKFIEVTEVTEKGENKKAFVNVDKILAVLERTDHTYIRFIEEGVLTVSETYEEIKAELEVVMPKLKWRDAKKELPTNKVDDDGLPVVCLVVVFHNGKPYFYKDWISSITKKWANTNHDDVKYWMYLDEIPLPKE